MLNLYCATRFEKRIEGLHHQRQIIWMKETLWKWVQRDLSTHREVRWCKMCVPEQKSLPLGKTASTHSLKIFLTDYRRLSSSNSKRKSLKHLQLGIHTFKELSRWSLGSLCPIAVYSDRMTAVHYQIISLPKGVAKLVNDKFGWATWIALEAILLCRNFLPCASRDNLPLQGWLSNTKKSYMFSFLNIKRAPSDLVDLFMRIPCIAEQTATNWKLKSVLVPSI